MKKLTDAIESLVAAGNEVRLTATPGNPPTYALHVMRRDGAGLGPEVTELVEQQGFRFAGSDVQLLSPESVAPVAGTTEPVATEPATTELPAVLAGA